MLSGDLINQLVPFGLRHCSQLRRPLLIRPHQPKHHTAGRILRWLVAQHAQDRRQPMSDDEISGQALVAIYSGFAGCIVAVDKHGGLSGSQSFCS